MTMISNNIKSAYTNFISENHYTHAMTLKPNGIKVGAASPVYNITTDSSRIQLTAPRLDLGKTQYDANIKFNDRALFSKLRKFYNYFDRKLVGTNYHLPKNQHLRTRIIAIAEGNEDTGHLHCAIAVHETRLQRFNELFPENLCGSEGKKLWNKVCVGGTFEIEQIYDQRNWAGYMAKSLVGDNMSDRIRFYPE